MIGQMKVLLKVKTLKEEQALRAMMAKRRQVADGETAVAAARAVEAESAATLGSREDAIYAGILGRVVGLDDLDDTRGAVVRLEQDHARLTDATERATHVLHRLNEELLTSVAHHRGAVKVKDKYTILTDDLREKADAAATYAEDSEIEELFGNKRQGLA